MVGYGGSSKQSDGDSYSSMSRSKKEKRSGRRAGERDSDYGHDSRSRRDRDRENRRLDSRDSNVSRNGNDRWSRGGMSGVSGSGMRRSPRDGGSRSKDKKIKGNTRKKSNKNAKTNKNRKVSMTGVHVGWRENYNRWKCHSLINPNTLSNPPPPLIPSKHTHKHTIPPSLQLSLIAEKGNGNKSKAGSESDGGFMASNISCQNPDFESDSDLGRAKCRPANLQGITTALHHLLDFPAMVVSESTECRVLRSITKR